MSIKRVNVTKLLGIYIDESLTFKSHIKDVNSRFSKFTCILHQLRIVSIK